MTQPSLTDLLAQWEKAYLQGRDIPPAELCPGLQHPNIVGG
jgi:hypothetical protein